MPRPQSAQHHWVFRRPHVGWLLLAMLFLAAGVLNLLLAIAMSDWLPLILVAASAMAAASCALTAFDGR